MEQVKRGPGRPPGSTNRPKEPPLSSEQREALKLRLATDYADAVVTQALAHNRIRGIKALARAKLGPAGWHEIESKLDVAERQGADALPAEAAAETNEAGSAH